MVADRLECRPGVNAVADWLVAASKNCASFAVPMLLLAAIHREILRRNPACAKLAAYFPTVGGSARHVGEEMGAELDRVILGHKEAFADFLQSSTVQTNETARGLCWLLPAFYLPWPEMVLLDLGCSAGLNLVADLRHYCLRNGSETEQDFGVGTGRPPQFIVTAEGPFTPPDQQIFPQIRARIGCDLHPFGLEKREDEQTLASFVWGDQEQRLARLIEGIAARSQIQKSRVPVQLYQAHLPDDLPEFLVRRLPPSCSIPAVIYNTYLTSYLTDKGATLRTHLDQWARNRTQPVLWLQWEPFPQKSKPPELGWLGWTAELWSNGQHRKWHLAWVHPHGGQVRWLNDWVAWARFWSSSH